MAAITHIRSAAPTTNATTYTDTAFTPSAGVLLIVAAVASGTVANADLTSSSGLTFVRAATATKNSGADTIYLFVANDLTTGAEEQLTFDCTGDGATGAIRLTGQITGMTKTGSAAVRQFKALSNQAAGGTPAITFDSACLTDNPTLGVLGNGSNPIGVTAPTSWSELNARAYDTPTTGGHYVGRDSGFTGTTITWGSTSATAFGGLIVEFDASASDGRTGTMAATESGADDATASGAVVVAGTFAATEAGADDATMSGAVVVAGTLAATETGGDTFAGSGTVDGGEEPAPEQPAQPTYGAAPHTLDPRKVYAKYEEIEAIERRIRAKEEAEREKIAALEQEKRRLADLALKKRQTKTLLERRRKLEARIAAYQGEIAELRAAMVELLEEIERLQMEAELQQTLALRRRRLLLAVATAA
jgi:hypothetical protein